MYVSLMRVDYFEKQALGLGSACSTYFGKRFFLFMLIAILKPTAEPAGNAFAKLYWMMRNHKFCRFYSLKMTQF